jgi:uncharacterized protein with PQ loop repeat
MAFLDSIEKELTWDILGYASGFVIAFSLLPQVWKTARSRSAADISLPWTLVYNLGLAGFLWYRQVEVKKFE